MCYLNDSRLNQNGVAADSVVLRFLFNLKHKEVSHSEGACLKILPRLNSRPNEIGIGLF